jgi:hypothetical protein
MHACRPVGLVLGEPAQLAHGVRRVGEETRAVEPGGIAELPTELIGRVRRARVVPEDRVPCGGPGLVEEDRGVLLSGDAHGRGADRTGPADAVQGRPPVLGVELRAVRMGKSARADEFSGRGIDDDELRLLCGRVDARHQGAGHLSPPGGDRP